MKNQAYRYLSLALLGFALLMALPGMAAAQNLSLLGNDPVASDWPSLTKAACHGNVSCQPNYPSCASWSGYSSCGTPWCGSFRGCGECEEFPCPGPAWKEYVESFRVCFDQWGNSCTEWVTYLNVSCGC